MQMTCIQRKQLGNTISWIPTDQHCSVTQFIIGSRLYIKQLSKQLRYAPCFNLIKHSLRLSNSSVLLSNISADDRARLKRRVYLRKQHATIRLQNQSNSVKTSTVAIYKHVSYLTSPFCFLPFFSFSFFLFNSVLYLSFQNTLFTPFFHTPLTSLIQTFLKFLHLFLEKESKELNKFSQVECLTNIILGNGGSTLWRR